MSTKKGKNYPQQRVREFPNEGFIVGADGLLCSACNKVIDATKSSTVKDHISSKKHKENRKAMKSTPSVRVQFQSKDVWRNLVEIFLESGVPLYIFRNENFRAWMRKNGKSGSTMPSETSARRMLDLSAKEDQEVTKSMLKNQDVIVVADESTDLKNRKVLNILLSSAQQNSRFRLVATKFLDEVNSATICSSVIDTIRDLGTPYDRVICLCSDNAPYMIAAGRTLKGIFSRMFHTTCWSHVLHLIGEEIRIKLQTADDFIAAMKAALVKAPNRREELLTCLEAEGHQRRLPPSPVLTRWCTWLEAGAFHLQHFQAELNWINSTTDDSAAINKLKRLTSGENTKTLREELQKVADICPTLSSAIKTLESNSLPASTVWLELKTVKGAYAIVFEEESPKLSLYMESKHPAVDFWEEVQFFDPRKMSVFSSEENQLPASLKCFQTTEIPMEEYLKCKEIIKSYAPNEFCPFKFWTAYKKEIPLLSSCAIRALSIPSSSAEVERSFSALRRLLTPQRSSFTEVNLGSRLKLMFNKAIEVTESTLESEQEDDSDYDDQM